MSCGLWRKTWGLLGGRAPCLALTPSPPPPEPPQTRTWSSRRHTPPPPPYHISGDASRHTTPTSVRILKRSVPLTLSRTLRTTLTLDPRPARSLAQPESAPSSSSDLVGARPTWTSSLAARVQSCSITPAPAPTLTNANASPHRRSRPRLSSASRRLTPIPDAQPPFPFTFYHRTWSERMPCRLAPCPNQPRHSPTCPPTATCRLDTGSSPVWHEHVYLRYATGTRATRPCPSSCSRPCAPPASAFRSASASVQPPILRHPVPGARHRTGIAH